MFYEIIIEYFVYYWVTLIIAILIFSIWNLKFSFHCVLHQNKLF